MRKSDCIWLAAKWAFGAKNILFLIGLAAAVYCACVSGGLISGVQAQKDMPYELNATAGSARITDNIVVKAGQVDGVLASSAQLNVPVTLLLGDTVTQMGLDGIAPEYMQGTVAAGTVFPKESAMPYIVLNQAAFDQLQDKNKDGNIDDSEKIDWQKAPCSITLGYNKSAAHGNDKPAATGENKSAATEENKSAPAGDNNPAIAAKICGILADGTKDPKAYISLFSAKKLANGEYTACLVRVRNSDLIKDVSDKISSLGLVVQNPDPAQRPDWDQKITEATYLLLLGIALIFYSVYLYTKAENCKEGFSKKKLDLLMNIGFSSANIRGVYLIKNIFYFCTAFGFGVLFYALIPWFLPPDLRQVLNIAYPFNTGGVLFGTALCAAAFLICFSILKSVIRSTD